jgi:hypothetical protein
MFSTYHYDDQIMENGKGGTGITHGRMRNTYKMKLVNNLIFQTFDRTTWTGGGIGPSQFLYLRRKTDTQ